MTSAKLIDFRKRKNLTSSDMADMLGVHSAQVDRWETGKQKIPCWLNMFMDSLDRNEPNLDLRSPSEV